MKTSNLDKAKYLILKSQKLQNQILDLYNKKQKVEIEFSNLVVKLTQSELKEIDKFNQEH